MTDDPIPLAKGQVLGRYELLAPVARGGMGQVWVARLRGARGFQKLVAIKTLLPASEDAGRMELMLLEEARLAALVQHANVAQTLELGEHEGTLYLVMEWIDGEPLSYLLTSAEQRGGMPLAIAVNLVAQTLRGLHAAHELVDETGALLGVVHRDVSPHNVLVTYGGLAKLVDFGIAKAIHQHASSTATGEIKGKFSYMAPEQILGEAIDRRADIFSVGIMLYTLTAGHHPFKNHSSAGVLHSITSDEPAIRPSLKKPGYSRTLEAVVLKALEKSPAQRWSSADEMRLALQRAVPHAFSAGIEEQLRAYLAELVGDRAALKREALRKAELSSEGSARSSGALKAASATAQSASSLRAISVDKPNPDSEASRVSRAPTFRPPAESVAEVASSRQWSARRWWVASAFGLAAAAAIALVSRHQGSQSRVSATSPSVGMVELSSPRSSGDAPARAAAAESAAAESVSPTPSSVPASDASPSIPSAAAVSSAKAPHRPPSHPARGATPLPAKARAATSKDADLIAPDYAR